MGVAKTGRKTLNQNVGHLDRYEAKRDRYRYAKLIEESEEMIEEIQQQMLHIKKKLAEKTAVHEKAILRLKQNLLYGWIYNEKWRPVDEDEYFRPDCPKKMVLDKLTFANNACRDKKAVVSFSSGEREINVHNLSYQMLHGTHSIDGERRLLKMLNPKKDIDSGLSLKQVEEQVCKTYWSMKWPINDNSTSTRRKLKELEWERDKVFVNAPCKASLWNSLPSTKDLRKQIQVMEARDEEKRERVLVRRKKIESKERKIKKAENEVKSMGKMMEMVRKRKQRALDTLLHQKSCLEK